MPNLNTVYPFAILGLLRSVFAKIKSTQPTDTSPSNPNGAKIKYVSEGRSGKVVYESAEATFALYYEFGGGDVVACIDIPSEQNWEKHTGLPLGQRDEVLHFIGKQVAKDQISSGKGSYKIEKNWLNIYA